MKTLILLFMGTTSLLAMPVEFRNYSGGGVQVTDGTAYFILGTGVSRLDLNEGKWKVICSNYSTSLPVDTGSMALGKSELLVTADQKAGLAVVEVDGWWMTFLRGMAFGVSVCGLALITRIVRKVAAPGADV